MTGMGDKRNRYIILVGKPKGRYVILNRGVINNLIV
jgi:hypothetical protein